MLVAGGERKGNTGRRTSDVIRASARGGTVDIPLTVFAIRKNTDYYLHIKVCQKYDTNYAPADTKSRHKQFDLEIRQDELEVRDRRKSLQSLKKTAFLP